MKKLAGQQMMKQLTDSNLQSRFRILDGESNPEIGEIDADVIQALDAEWKELISNDHSLQLSPYCCASNAQSVDRASSDVIHRRHSLLRLDAGNRLIVSFDPSAIKLDKVNESFAHDLSTRLKGRKVVRTNSRGLFLQVGLTHRLLQSNLKPFP